MPSHPPSKVLITGGREVGGLRTCTAAMAAGFTALGIPNELISPQKVLGRLRDLRDPSVLKIMSTTAVFAVPFARRAICVAHGFPRPDAQGWIKSSGIFTSFKLANLNPQARLVAVSHYAASHLELLGLRIDAVIHNALSPFFTSGPSVTDERRYLTYVGRLVPVKNIHRLLPAMRDAQRLRPNFHICIIGDGPQRESLQAAFRNDPEIEFTGNLDAPSVRQYLRQTKVFVSGCVTEAFPGTYLEALSQGCIVAMPACGGGLEIALEEIGRRFHLLPLSFDRAESAAALVRALDSPEPATKFTGWNSPVETARAYLSLDSSFFANGAPLQ